MAHNSANDLGGFVRRSNVVLKPYDTVESDNGNDDDKLSEQRTAFLPNLQ
jgi:hypothetical protein